MIHQFRSQRNMDDANKKKKGLHSAKYYGKRSSWRMFWNIFVPVLAATVTTNRIKQYL